MLNLPEHFEEYSEAKKKGFLRMKELKESGKKVAGIFCTYTPEELVMAADGVTVGLCGTGEDGILAAEQHLPKNLCPLIKSSYGLAVTDTCPYFYFSDMILAETTCDGKKKMYELMGKLKPTHVMQLPPGRDGELSLQFWAQEMHRAAEVISAQFETQITEVKLRQAIQRKNRERRAMLRLYEIGKLKPCPTSGYELSTLAESVQFLFSSEEKIQTLENRAKELEELYENELKGKPSRPRILITGCPIGGVREKIIKQIEELGADVVAFESCSGPRSQMDLVDETLDPYRALAEKYLRINCSVMSPNTGRFDTLSEMIDDYKIDGVLEVTLQACHTFAIEANLVKAFVTRDKGLPYLGIETDYSQSDTGQISTRLAAFLEVLEQ